MKINSESKLSLKFMLLFIPVAYASYLFHELDTGLLEKL